MQTNSPTLCFILWLCQPDFLFFNLLSSAPRPPLLPSLSFFPLLCFVAWQCAKEPWTLNSFILGRERQEQGLAPAHTATKKS